MDDYLQIPKVNIIISPWSKAPINGVKPAKDYPFEDWLTVVELLRERAFCTTQIGLSGEKLIGCDQTKFGLTFRELVPEFRKALTFISVDNGIQHFAHFYGIRGVVIFSKSSPKYFGYIENINLLKDPSYLRRGREAWKWWNDCPYEKEAFVSPREIVEATCKLILDKGTVNSSD